VSGGGLPPSVVGIVPFAAWLTALVARRFGGSGGGT
jgi:hypothetical protein